MTERIIGVPDENDSYFRITLENTLYHIRFTWNETGQFWKFSLYTSLEEPIIEGVKIVPDFPLNVFYVTWGLPFGVFYCKTRLERVGRKDFVNGAAEFRYISARQNQQ